jgi:putative ABC transport system permease protein
MLKNYLLLAFKHMAKQKVFSLINILGLTVGITCCLMIFLYIQHEKSYDRFHKDGDRIYRVVRQADINGANTQEDIGFLSGPYSIALRNDFPQYIERAVRVNPDNDLFSYGTQAYNEQRVYITDTDFFQLFNFNLIKGDPALVLKNPHSIVLTESTAKKYFGNADPIGKVLKMNQDLPLQVTGICKDAPTNSHMVFDMVIPINNFGYFDSLSMFPNNGLFVYLKLKPNVNPSALTAQFPHFMDKYMGKYLVNTGVKIGLGLEQLHDIYFQHLTYDQVKHGDKKVVYIFMSIAILILSIACINFMNLATARINDRSKEVGLRKVLGAVRRQLIGQFILESFLYATLSSLLALAFLQLCLPAYSGLIGYVADPFWSNSSVYLFLGSIIVIIGFLAGLYPALVLSSLSPIETLKGKFKVGKNGAFFRKVLVVFQFSISVLLIICITVIMCQMRYVQNTDLGFDKEQSLVVKLDNNAIQDKRLLFKHEVENDPSVISTAFMSGEPGGFHDIYTFETEVMPGQKVMYNTEFTDFQFTKTLGLKIIAGRDFSPQYPSDSTEAVLINRTTAKKMGLSPDQAIGKWIQSTQRNNERRSIIGVVEDYHYESLRKEIGPMVISTYKDWRVAVIRLKPGNPQEAIARLQKIYAEAAPGYPFEYNFLDASFNEHYKDDIRQGNILTLFSALAIFIACLGLFGLASYTAMKRTKEIGVRKVLGSSVQSVVILLSKDLLKPVVLATLLSIPISWYIMDKWLEGFAYRITLQWWMFVGAALVAIGIALLTVSSQAFKAALTNPVKSLRSE